MKKIAVILLASSLLAGCASIVNVPEAEPAKVVEKINPELLSLPEPDSGKVVVAVYGFQDKTGQRKPSDRLANISFAVTQGAESILIETLQRASDGKFFRVVERVGLDNLTKERQIIRQTRQSVGDEKELPPMLFAGVIMEGGITGYDSNTLTGGAGARYLGIGPSTQYRQDVVTINLRAVSVQTGEVLISTTVTKTIISTGTSLTFFRFYELGTEAAEAEIGNTINEPVSYAVRSAIETAVVDLVMKGADKGYWKLKE